jgi:VRR-NUC domain/FAN1, HTH domain
VIKETTHRYTTVFTENENKIIEPFFKLPLNAQKLYVRMFNRKPSWFKRENLNYDEINNIDLQLHNLELNGFLEFKKPKKPELSELYNVLTKKDLFEILPHLKKTLNKDEIFFELHNDYNQIKNSFPKLYFIKHEEIFNFILLLYFGNPYQDLSTIVVDEIENLKYVKIPLSEEKIWKNRKQIDEYIDAFNLRWEIKEFIYEEEFFKAHRRVKKLLRENYSSLKRVPDYKKNRTANYVILKLFLEYSKVVEKQFPSTFLSYMKTLEKFYYPSELSTIYYEKQIISAKKFKKPKKVNSLLNELIQKSKNPNFEELTLIEKTQSWLQKKRRTKIQTKIKKIELPKGKRLNNRVLYSINGVHFYVEDAVILKLKEENHTSFHSENLLIPTIAGILFFDEIFTSVKGMFQSNYQIGPLDFYKTNFYKRRKTQFDKKFSELNKVKDFFNYFKENYDLHFKKAIPSVFWNGFTKNDLYFIVQNIPPKDILILCKRYLEFPKIHKRGMPDLITFKENNYSFIEVKSPNDKLSEAQKHWINYMEQNQIPIYLAKIEEV